MIMTGSSVLIIMMMAITTIVHVLYRYEKGMLLDKSARQQVIFEAKSSRVKPSSNMVQKFTRYIYFLSLSLQEIMNYYYHRPAASSTLQTAHKE